MSQILSSTRIPVPNVDLLTSPWIGDHGTLFIRTGQTWHVFDGVMWAELSIRELYKTHKVRPPSNVDDGWLGIAPGPYSANWNKRDLKSAMNRFMEQHASKYIPADGCCWDPLKKARLLKRDKDRRDARVWNDQVIFKAPRDRVVA